MLKSQKLKRLRQKQIACIGNAGLERENRRCCRIIAKRGSPGGGGKGEAEMPSVDQTSKFHPKQCGRAKGEILHLFGFTEQTITVQEDDKQLSS
ncbi:Queuine tRNA-ribosyltransferase catalytic subunit [Trichinella spiralis]|uniref:Queuine tRNA-ribosyltransferase catalytic subunit n=1 Tax=Trichinella spiralis TaxID=6334 RepID=A0ABR3KNB9_TRISP